MWLRFYLLGPASPNNPSAISYKTIIQWEQEGLITYINEASDVRPYIAKASCIVLPSFYKEGVPRVLLEAMSMGKPIITTHVSGAKECVLPPFRHISPLAMLFPKHHAKAPNTLDSLSLNNSPQTHETILQGINGFLIPPHNPHALAHACAYLASHQALAKSMGEKGREIARTRFSIESIITIYRSCVNDILTSAPSLKPSNNLQHPHINASNHINASLTTPYTSSQTPQQDVQGENKALQGKFHIKQERTLHKEPTHCIASKIKEALARMKQNLCMHHNKKQETRANTLHRDNALHNDKSLTHHIAFISNTCFSMYNFRLPILRALRAEGYIIHIIAPLDAYASLLRSEGFLLHHLRIDSRSLNPLNDLCTLACLIKLLRRVRPHLIFHYTIKPSIYGSFISRLLHIPHIAIITGLGYVFINDKGHTSSLKKKLLRAFVCFLYRCALKKAREVWFLNPDDRQEFCTHALIRPSQARVLPSEGIDTEHFSPHYKTSNAPLNTKSTIKPNKLHSIPNETHPNANAPQANTYTSPHVTATMTHTQQPFTFLLIARMLWDKGIGEFIEAARILQEQQISSNAQINDSWGGGGNVRTAQSSIAHSAPSMRFFLLGSVNAANPSAIDYKTIMQWEQKGLITYINEASDVRPYIAKASCIVLPSYKEGAPRVLLEAMSMGKPIITTHVSGAKECVLPPFIKHHS